jgi:hypothetical protein
MHPCVSPRRGGRSAEIHRRWRVWIEELHLSNTAVTSGGFVTGRLACQVRADGDLFPEALDFYGEALDFYGEALDFYGKVLGLGP